MLGPLCELDKNAPAPQFQSCGTGPGTTKQKRWSTRTLKLGGRGCPFAAAGVSLTIGVVVLGFWYSVLWDFHFLRAWWISIVVNLRLCEYCEVQLSRISNLEVCWDFVCSVFCETQISRIWDFVNLVNLRSWEFCILWLVQVQDFMIFEFSFLAHFVFADFRFRQLLEDSILRFSCFVHFVDLWFCALHVLWVLWISGFAFFKLTGFGVFQILWMS